MTDGAPLNPFAETLRRIVREEIERRFGPPEPT